MPTPLARVTPMLSKLEGAILPPTLTVEGADIRWAVAVFCGTTEAGARRELFRLGEKDGV